MSEKPTKALLSGTSAFGFGTLELALNHGEKGLLIVNGLRYTHFLSYEPRATSAPSPSVSLRLPPSLFELRATSYEL